MSQGGSNYKKTISGVALYRAYVRGKKIFARPPGKQDTEV